MAEGERQESSRIFISYRREDSAGFVRALLGPLRQRFGSDRIFKDTDNIPPGEDFVKAIRRELESCKVLLAVIGGEWMTVEDPRTKKRRLDNPNDYLRIEVATALKNEHVVVIPVLVDRAGMPSTEDLPEDLGLLARRNAIELSDSRWDTDIDRLVRAIEAICNDPALEEPQQVEPPPREPGKSARVPSGDTSAFERLELKRKRQIAEHMAVARQAFEIQDFEAVLAACESAIWLDPQEPEARDLAERSRAALDERQIQEWLAEAARALAKAELAAASEAIDQALARSPTHPDALKLRQDLLRARQERERQREVDRLVAVAMKRARARLEEEDFSAALSHVEDALALAPESREAHELKAQIVAARDELQRARELKRRAQQTVTAAQTEFAAGKHDAALSRLEQFAPAHDLVARALADLRQQAEEAKETARREKAARDAEAAAEEARETARREKAARAAEVAAEEARETARREKAARDAEAAAEVAKRERQEQAAREEAARLAAAAKARQEQIEQAARKEAARLAAAAKARQEQIEQAARDEEARRLEQAVAGKLETASKVDDHQVALKLLNEALMLAPGDPRIHAQIAQRDAALQNQRAEEQRRQAEAARRLEEAREREEAARKREEALGKILAKARNEPVDEDAIRLLNDGLRIAPGDPRFQSLVSERTAALERKRADALEKAAAEKARREQERQAHEQKTRRERQEKEERARRALEEKQERALEEQKEQARQSRERLAREAEQEPQHRTESEVDDKVEPRPVSIKFLGIAAAVIALVTVGVWLARSPAPTTVVQPSGEAARDLTSPETPSPATTAGGPAAPASPPATETRGNVQPAGSPATATPPVGSPATATRGAVPLATATRGAAPPVTATRGTPPVARPPATPTRGTAPPSSAPSAATRGAAAPPASPPAESVTAVAVPAAGPPPAEAAPVAGAPPTTGTTGTTPPVASNLAADRPAIQELLERYVTAYSRMDERSLKAIDPSFRGIARRELIRSVTLTLGQPVIDVSPDGQSAKLRATGEFRYVWNRSGLPPTSPAQWTWNLRKVGTTWTVVP